jgi:hypothetical protein
MANNPIQVVLNAQSYVDFSNNQPGGSNKDFFAGRDSEFGTHKEMLINQVSELQRSLNSLPKDELVYARVELQSDAWAKSHRPTKKVFPARDIASLSGPKIGSIVIEITAEDLPKIIATVRSAEPLTNWEEKDGKTKAKPSRTRSEVGAIQSIRGYDASDRRRFSLGKALQWLSDPRTGGAYYVETFVSHRSIDERANEKTKQRALQALEAFESRLMQLGLPIDVTRTSEKWTHASFYIVKVKAEIESKGSIAIHEELLSFLESQSIVKSILLPPILQTAHMPGGSAEAPAITAPDTSRSYPVIGIVDSGVTDFPGLAQWSVGSLDFLPKEQQDVSHGTFIAGLVCAAEELNSHPIFNEAKCQFFDLGLHPTAAGSYQNYYPRGFIDFLEQLDAEIPSAKELGARIFNMSLAVTAPIADESYSMFANLLDEIADKHDVLFVLPAGNLEESIARDEWPSDPNEAATMLLSYRYAGLDRIYQPADSIRSVVVGALNPPDHENALFPSRYTRRGPGPSLGAKPDIAHVGGRFDTDSGLHSFFPDGTGIQSCGTSYAAPLAARTIAVLDHVIEGGASREALIALVVHHATPPDCLTSNQLKTVKKDFVGAGVPCPAAETLLVGDHEITLVFNGIIHGGKELNFQFSWPASLVEDAGECSGNVKLTLVYRPPIDREQGGEFVRVNLDAFLRQEDINKKTGKVSFLGRLKGDGAKHYEKELVQHGAKWWPVKRLEDELKNVGRSSQWRLVVEPLARSDFSLPDEGIPFTVILTISDKGGTKPVFNEMRQQLQLHGATISDIRTAARARARK